MAYWTIRGIKGDKVYVNGFQLPENSRLQIQEIDDYILYPLESVHLASVQEEANLKGILFAVQIELQSSSFDFLEGRVTFSTNQNQFCLFLFLSFRLVYSVFF